MKILTPISRKIKVGGDEYLYFGGTAYLGIPQHKSFRALYLEGLEYYGLNNGTSRSNNVQLSIYDEVEQYAAKSYGAEACLITSSGYLAAQLTVKELSGMGKVCYAPATHPALWLNEVPRVDGSFSEWAEALVEKINQSDLENWVIISNSLNNLYPEIYDFSFVKEIHDSKKVILIVDDSHGLGVTNDGKGVFSTLPKQENIELVVIASMAKALGVDAGLVFGTDQMISKLKHANVFLGASPPSAAGLFAFMHASAIYKEEHEKLMRLSTKFEARGDWSFVPGFPVYLSNDPGLAEYLKAQQILISSFAYPDKKGRLLNRIVLSSWHTLADIEELILALPKT
ncbi:MAG: aminotransferase class I/II-fold pyridoxal phosphate-dependent enzyme [Bacteroidia bacterium]